MKKRWARLVVTILTAIAGILVLIPLLLQAPPVKHFAFEQFCKHLQHRSGIQLQASEVHLDFLRGAIRLENPLIRSVSSPEFPPLFKAARIYAKLNIPDIVRGHWTVEKLALAAPQIHYFVDQNGHTNLPKSAAASSTAADLLVLQAEAVDGVFRLQNIQQGVTSLLPRWRLTVEGNRLTRAHRIVFASQKESVLEYKTCAIPINSLDFSGTLSKAALRVDRAQIVASNSKLSITGSLNDLSRPSVNLQLAANVDLSRIAQTVSMKEKVQGGVAGTIQLSGDLQNPQITARLKGTDIRTPAYQGTGLDLRASAAWIRDSGKWIVRYFDFASPEGSLNGSAEFSPGPGPGIHSIETSIQNFNLLPLWKQLRPPFDLASRATGKISLRWKGAWTPSQVTGEAHLHLDATRSIPGPNLLPVSGILDARMRSDYVLGKIQSFTVLGTQVRGQFALHSFREIEGNFQGDSPNIDVLMAQLSRFLGNRDSSLVGIRMAGPFQFSAQASGRLNRPKIAVSVDVQDLRAGALKNLSVKTNATIEGSRVVFQSAVGLPQESTIVARGELELGGRVPVLNLDARANPASIAALGSMLDVRIPVTGNLSGSLRLNGATDSLIGSASITGNDLFFYREPMGHLDVDLRMSGKEIRSTQFKLSRDPHNPEADCLNARFSYALDSGQFQFQAEGKDLTLRQWAFPGGNPLKGAIDLSASGTGTIEQPLIRAKLESSDIRVGQRSLGPVSVDAVLRDEQLAIEALAARLNLSSRMLVASRTPYPFSAELQANNSDLSLLRLKEAGGQSWKGAIEGVLKGSGNLKELEQARFSAWIQKLHLQSGKLELETKDPIQVEYRDNSIEVLSSATIVSGNSKLEVTGRVPLRQPAPEGTLRFKGQIDLAHATGLVSIPQGFAATGTLNLDFALAGTPEKANSAGAITLDGGVVQLPKVPVPLTDVTIRASVQDGSLLLQQASASWEQGRVALSGELPFGLLPRNIPVQFPRKEGPACFDLDLTNLKPELTGMFPKGVTGLVSLHAAGQTTGADPRALQAQLLFKDLSFKVNDIGFSQKEPSGILVRDGIAFISHLSLIGPQTNVDIGGSAGILPNGTMDLRLVGNIDAALLTSTSRDPKVAGNLQVRILVAGNRNAPVLSGIAAMNGGKLSIRNPRVVADSLTVRLNLSPNEIAVQEFAGTLNGGSIAATGTIGYRGGKLDDFNLKATLQDFFLNFPEGLRSASSGDLRITSSDDSIVVSGNLRASESSYREPIEVGGQLMNYLRAQQVLEAGREPSPFLDRIRLNIAVRTDTPLLVQNNLAKVEATANLRIVGTFYEPSMVGRINLNEGGEIVLNRQTYYVSRGIITLANQTYIEPELNIRAQTKAGSYDVTLQLTGTPERLTTMLTSEPQLSETEILSLLLTGKTASETQNPGMIRTQALSLLAGEAGEELTRGARQALHLSTFRIDPGLITSESDPGARLTIGEDITKNFSLAYSMNLTNGGDQIWTAQYEIARRLTAHATKQQDNSYRFEFSHDLRFGGRSGSRPARSPVPKLEIGSIQFQGGGLFPDQDLRNRLKAKPGDKYDFPKIQKGLDRLQEFFVSQKRLEADMHMQRETRQTTVDLKLNINPGPVVIFSYEGIPISGRVKKKVEEAWTNAVFDTERFDDASMAIRRPLIQEGYLQSQVTHKVAEENDEKRVHFQITPATRYANIAVTFPGASEISAAELHTALDLADLKLDVYSDPQKVVDNLERYYRERGYLQVRIDLPKPQLDPATGTGQTAIRVQEGPLFTIGELEFDGNHAFNYDQLWSVIPTSSGSSYDPNTLRDAVKAMENLYRGKGYNDATITFRVVQDSQTAHANLTFQITERKQSVIRDIVIEGNRGTSQDFVQRQLDFRTGDPLDFAKISETRKRLYATGVYASVDFQTEEMPAITPDSREKDVRVQVRLREIRPFRLQYGVFYDTDRGIGGLLEAQNLNVLGRAANLGLRLRYDSDLKEARAYFGQPFVTKIHLKMDASAFIQKETRSYFSAKRIGFSLFREKELPRKYRFDYGYRYDHVRWNGLPPDPTIFQASVPVARVIATLTRDTRDSILDATRGEFSSHSLEFGPRWLGSEIGFARYYGQYFRYVPLDKFLGWPRKDKEGRQLPARLVYAGALRLGLTDAFSGQPMISPERFFAGGGTTMRGFEQDRLGPLETLPDGETVRPTGGEALFLFNNEIRFPIFGILQGVGFVDIGNVYSRLSDFDFSMRKSAGVGLRIKIKYVPLRIDYGFKLDRKPGESAHAFFFSIGQAF